MTTILFLVLFISYKNYNDVSLKYPTTSGASFQFFIAGAKYSQALKSLSGHNHGPFFERGEQWGKYLFFFFFSANYMPNMVGHNCPTPSQCSAIPLFYSHQLFLCHPLFYLTTLSSAFHTFLQY